MATTTPYSGPSVVDYLTSVGKASDFNSRAAMAKQYNIANYTGTADQNTQLLGYLRGGSTPVSPINSSGGVGSNSYGPALPTVPTNTGSPATPATATPVASTNSSTPPPGWSATAWAQQQADMAKYFPTVPTNTNPTPNTNTGGATPATASSAPGQPSMGSILTPVNSSETSNDILNRLLQSMTPSQEETNLQSKLADLEAKRTSFTNLNNGRATSGEESIASPYISGQDASQNANVAAAEAPIQTNLSTLQAERQQVQSGLSTALGYENQVLPYGSSVYNPVTGTTSGGIFGSSTSAAGGAINPSTGLSPTASSGDILGYLAKNGINVTRYDAPGLITAIQNGATAQDIINAQAVAAGTKSAATTGAGWTFNPATGTYTQRNAGALTQLGAGAPSGASSVAGPASGGQGGALSIGASGNDVTALQQWLISQGYNIPAGATGYYGAQTQAAVAAFQQAAGVDTSGGGAGVFGPRTQAAAAQKGFGTGGGSSTGGQTAATGATTPLDNLSSSAYYLATTGDFPSGIKYQTQQDQVLSEVRAAIPGFNPAIAKANQKAIGEQVTQQADTARAITAADSNFKLMTQTFGKSGVNDYQSPLANQLANKVKLGLLGDSDVANFTSAVSTLQTEYAMVLGRGGEVTDAVRKSSQNVINGNYSMQDLVNLHDYIQKEGKNVIDSFTKTINQLASSPGVAGNVSGGDTTGSGTSGVTPGGVSYTIH